jgi:hypothetical protein
MSQWGRRNMRRTPFTTIMLVLGIVFAVQTNSGAEAQPKKEAASEAKGKTGFDVLKGRWVRPDGGYVIQIRNVDGTGKIDAGYLNPRPINVSKAQATKESGKIKVFVELSDVGYPGSTYTLTYDAKQDVLVGVYHQAVMKQDFDVYFTRIKE